MTDKTLKRLSSIHWAIWLLMMIITAGFLYHSIFDPNTLLQFIEAPIIIGLSITLTIIKKREYKLKITEGELKEYGIRSSSITSLLSYYIFGFAFFIFALISFYTNEINESIVMITISINWFISALAHKKTCYLQITNKNIIISDSHILNKKRLVTVTISDYMIELSTNKRTYSIILEKLRTDEIAEVQFILEEIVALNKK